MTIETPARLVLAGVFVDGVHLLGILGRIVNTFDHTNLSREPDYVIRQWLTISNAIKVASRVISLPDTCPGKSPLPTGTAFLTSDPGWRRFALSDVGCGMCVVRTKYTAADVNGQSFHALWDNLATDLAQRRNKGLGDLGSGNHFLDAAVSHADSSVCLVVHTGSRKESGLVDDLVDQPPKFDREFARIRTWARENRNAVLDIAEKRLGKFLRLTGEVERIDRDHNHTEELPGGMLIRKGVQRVPAGELAIIPSHLLDDMAIVRATPLVGSILHCLPHGTGRTMSRSDAKRVEYDFESMRSKVYIPSIIDNSSLRTEAPSCYRSLDDGLDCMDGYIDVVERLTPVAYIGQL